MLNLNILKVNLLVHWNVLVQLKASAKSVLGSMIVITRVSIHTQLPAHPKLKRLKQHIFKT